MSVASDCKSLTSGKIYCQSLHLKTSADTENTIDASEIRGAEEIDKSINRNSLEQIEGRIRPRTS